MSTWQPGATLETLSARASLLADIRQFFALRGVLEVETPLLCQAGVTDPALEALSVDVGGGEHRYLQTSPEYAMKRLLSAGSGDIFQISKAFRADELGSRHNPEYTLLEWYRLGVDHHQLLREVADLLCQLLELQSWQVWPWQALFEHFLSLNPHLASHQALADRAGEYLAQPLPDLDRDGLLDLCMSHVIEPGMRDWGMVFVVDYPASQAALARQFDRNGVALGARFECYVDGLEMANGYWEAKESDDLRARFTADNHNRQRRGQLEQVIDERLLAALLAGLPDCAGVALGVDRLLMCQQKLSHMDATLAFSWSRA